MNLYWIMALIHFGAPNRIPPRLGESVEFVVSSYLCGDVQMKRPERKRPSKKDRAVSPPPANVDLSQVAAKARYTGSVYHKDSPSFAGSAPRPRPVASICPRELSQQQAQVQAWLKAAILAGNFGYDWRQEFPHHVWHRVGTVVYEACLTNSGNGEYHGYPLEPDDIVEGLA